MTFGLLLGPALTYLGMMYGGNQQNAPSWDPSGNVSFRSWVRELQAWLALTSSRLGPSQQAASIQLSLRGVAR